MTPYADSDLTLIVRLVPLDSMNQWTALGWVERVHFYREGWEALVEWPIQNGDPVEPKEERVDG
jgi:hypothetical protein